MKHFLSVLLILITGHISKAQAPGFSWASQAQVIPGNGTSVGNSVALDNQGNSYITGAFYGTANFGVIPLTSTGSDDFFIAKYDASGHVLWARQGGWSVSLDRGLDIATDPNGNIYVTGFYQGPASFGSATLPYDNLTDFFIAKYDTNGNLLWIKRAGGTGNDSGTGIVVDSNGNSYVTGSFYGNVTFGNITLNGESQLDIFLAKYNTAGTLLWAKKVGAGWNNYYSAGDIALDANGNCYLSGHFSGNITFGNNWFFNPLYDDVFVAKYDNVGNLIWAKQIEGPSNCSGEGIAVDAGGNSYVTGYFYVSLTFDSIVLTGNGARDIFIAKLDPAGNTLWAKQAGANDFDSATDIVLDSIGNSYITGRFKAAVAFGSTTLTSSGDYDIFIAKYDNAGAELWAMQAGGSGFDSGNGITLDGNGNSYLTGNFTGSASFGSNMLTSNLGSHMFLTKINASPLDIKELNSTTPSITLEAQQNPFHQSLRFNLTTPSSSTIHLTLTDILGRIIEQHKTDPGEYNLNAAHLAPGLYILQAQQDGISRQLKVLKE